jgi:hypothetical protein
MKSVLNECHYQFYKKFDKNDLNEKQKNIYKP